MPGYAAMEVALFPVEKGFDLLSLDNPSLSFFEPNVQKQDGWLSTGQLPSTTRHFHGKLKGLR